MANRKLSSRYVWMMLQNDVGVSSCLHFVTLEHTWSTERSVNVVLVDCCWFIGNQAAVD